MITELDIAKLCQSIYAYPADARVAWDHFDDGAKSDGVCWGIKNVAGVAIIIFRGSDNFQDWVRDFDCWANPFHDDDLGPVHPGFYSGITTVQRELDTLVPHGTPTIVAGHSLGAGRAAILTGLLVLDQRKPIHRLGLGEPRPGFAQLADIVSTVPGGPLVNGDTKGHDLFTDVPFSFPPEDFTNSGALRSVSASPAADDAWGVFRYHHVQLYVQALGSIPNLPTIA